MAIRHGKAGQFGKSEAIKRGKHTIQMMLLLAGGGMFAAGFLLGYFWGTRGFVIGSTAFCGVLIAVLILQRRLEPYLDRIAKERVKYLRGGQAEALIAWLLEDLDDGWHIFNNIQLHPKSDVDHVVVGPGGLYCISTKSHRGLFTASSEGLRWNGQKSPFAEAALAQTLTLRNRIAAITRGDCPWIQAVLALPFGYVEGDACGGKVWLVHQEDITDRIAPENGPKKLSGEQIARLVKAMEMIKDGVDGVK